MKHVYRALCAIALLLSAGSAFAQGTVPMALSQTLDINGKPQAGALLYTFVVGTVAQPQTTYQDTALSIPNAWPLVADQNGRIPMFYLANGSVHLRLTDSAGNVQYDNANVLVIGPSSGSGSDGSVDPTTILSTGDLKFKYGTGTLSGFVRLNGLTIGNAISGGTERANADTQNLFVYLYKTDSNLVVSGGRTGNALNDYNSNKTITLPDWRGKTIAALGDMGNTATSVLTQTYANCTNAGSPTGPTTLGAWCGTQTNALLTANLPPYTPSGAVAANFPSAILGDAPNAFATGGCCVGYGGTSSGGTALNISGVGLPASFSGNAQGGSSSPFSNVTPMMLATFYIKL